MLNAINPPGRSNLNASRMAAGKSGPSIKAMVETTASKEASLKPVFWR